MSYSGEQVNEMKRQIEEKKMERQTEVNEKENQMGIKSKIENTKLQVEKWVQLENRPIKDGSWFKETHRHNRNSLNQVKKQPPERNRAFEILIL